jgi:hypothetical protein
MIIGWISKILFPWLQLRQRPYLLTIWSKASQCGTLVRSWKGILLYKYELLASLCSLCQSLEIGNFHPRLFGPEGHHGNDVQVHKTHRGAEVSLTWPTPDGVVGAPKASNQSIYEFPSVFLIIILLVKMTLRGMTNSRRWRNKHTWKPKDIFAANLVAATNGGEVLLEVRRFTSNRSRWSHTCGGKNTLFLLFRNVVQPQPKVNDWYMVRTCNVMKRS